VTVASSPVVQPFSIHSADPHDWENCCPPALEEKRIGDYRVQRFDYEPDAERRMDQDYEYFADDARAAWEVPVVANLRALIYFPQTRKRTALQVEHCSKNPATQWKTWSTWMTDGPKDVTEMMVDLEGVSGSVLLLGLGLGIAPTLLARDSRITEIVVVESVPEVIDLVWPATHAALPETLPATCVLANAWEFLQLERRTFDYVHVNIDWYRGSQQLEDHAHPLRRLARRRVRDQADERVRVWKERMMRGQLFWMLTNADAVAVDEPKDGGEARPSFVARCRTLCGGDDPLWFCSRYGQREWEAKYAGRLGQ
jgi:hypothetical protein